MVGLVGDGCSGPSAVGRMGSPTSAPLPYYIIAALRHSHLNLHVHWPRSDASNRWSRSDAPNSPSLLAYPLSPLRQLRDLDKQLRMLEKFKFIKELNLKGNP